jgi:hypothetical protein
LPPRGTVADRDHLDGVGRKASFLKPLDQAGVDGAGGMERIRSAAQNDGIAGLQAQGAGVGGDIGAAFINHADDAERGAHALDLEPVGTFPGGNDVTDGIGQGGNGANAIDDRIDAALIEFQPVDEGCRHVACQRRFDIERIGGEDLLPVRVDRFCHGVQRGILPVGRGNRKRSRGSPCAAADVGHQCSDVSLAHGLVEHGAPPGVQSGRFLTQSGWRRKDGSGFGPDQPITMSSRWIMAARPA